ncbi:MAG: acyl-CoA dehydrogenase [Myxococcota bacterium]
MAIAITDEHQELARVARSFLEANQARAATRALLDASEENLPAFWKDLAALGWLGLHIPEEHGGQGFGLEELSVVLEELAYALAPGPFLPTVLASAVIHEVGSDDQRRTLLPGLADGSAIGAVGLAGSLTRGADGVVEGSAGFVLGGGLADRILLPVGDDLVIVDRDQEGVRVESRNSLDPSRRVASVRCTGVRVSDARILTGARPAAVRLGRTLAAVEASGGAHACTEMASEYAKVRVQFGRVIGTFQAVKHHCANMISDAELATASAWDAARAGLHDQQAELASAVAATLALPAFLKCAKLNIQIHGGIGFTWEHDAHLYLRRAAALVAVFGPVERAEEDVTRLAAAGVKRVPALDLPPEAEEFRAEVRAFLDEYQKLPDDQKRGALIESGYMVPHWPKPFGREAGPVEQLVIDQEFAGINRGSGGWVELTLTQHATPEQVERWVRPSLEGKLRFCQLFSEPGAGSDAASIQTRAIKVEGGWRVTGQKIWTSGAQHSDCGFTTVRTDPDASKHMGITTMVIDMRAEGVDVRPLREITGQSMFNEVFLDDVFVPDEDVVGPVNGGWTVARSTLGNERVGIGAGTFMGLDPLPVMAKYAPNDLGVSRQLGRLVAENLAIRLLNQRRVARAVVGAEPAAEGNVIKLFGAEHQQRVADFCMSLLQLEGAVADGDAPELVERFLFNHCLTIGGGTSEISRNQIGERILGLPRDPLAK